MRATVLRVEDEVPVREELNRAADDERRHVRRACRYVQQRDEHEERREIGERRDATCEERSEESQHEYFSVVQWSNHRERRVFRRPFVACARRFARTTQERTTARITAISVMSSESPKMTPMMMKISFMLFAAA